VFCGRRRNQEGRPRGSRDKSLKSQEKAPNR
jgi:hypothetical protein